MTRYMPWSARLRPYLWWVVIVLALSLGVYFAGRQTVTAIRQDERTKVLAEGAQLVSVIGGAERAAFHRTIDSLRLAAARVDTVLDTLILRAKAESAAPLPPAADTTALLTAVRACRVTLDTLASACAQFRETATHALAVADTLHAQDTTALRGFAVHLAAMRRSDSAKAARLTERSRWHTIQTGACVGSVAFNVLTLLRK